MSTLTIRLTDSEAQMLDVLKQEMGEQAGSKVLLKAAKIVLDELPALKKDLEDALRGLKDIKNDWRNLIDTYDTVTEAEGYRKNIIDGAKWARKHGG